MRTIFKFDLPEMTCANCVEPVKNILTNKSWQLAGGQKIKITRLETNIVRKTFEVEIDCDEFDDIAIRDSIIEKLADVGTLAIAVGSREVVEVPHMFKGLLGIASGAGFLLLSVLGGGMPLLTTAVLTSISTLLSVYVGKEIFVEAYQKITRLHTLEMNALFSASALIAITASIVSLFIPWVPCMLEAALLTFGFRHLGLAIENRAKENVINGVSFIERTPKEVMVQNDQGSFELRPTKELKSGDIIQVAPEKIIPVDGICLSNEARLDISIIKGAIASKAVQRGFTIFAGMKVKGFTPIEMRVTVPVDDSFLARLDHAILQAETDKAPLEATSQTLLKYFVPGLFVLALATAGMAGMMFGAAMAIKCAVTLLVSACPCTLGSIVPLAVTVALNKASKEGVLFRSGKALQMAGKTDTVVFDLNGTLTAGHYSFSGSSFYYQVDDEEECLNCLYELENDSHHPIGEALQQYLTSIGYPKASVISERLPGPSTGGKKCRINGFNYYIGNRTMMAEQGVDLSEYPEDYEYGQQLVYFARENSATGEKMVLHSFIFSDPLKNDITEVIDELKKNGKDIHICTGADFKTASNYAARLDIPQHNIHADCVPFEDATELHQNTKTGYIRSLQAANKTVTMVGDAVNDAAALTASDLGVFIKSQASADIMETNADVVIQSASLKPLLAGFEIGSNMVQNIQQNLTLSFIYNFATLGIITCFACCAGIVLSPGIGVMMMIGQASIVMLNVQRFKQQEGYYTQTDTGASSGTGIYRRLGISPSHTINHQIEVTISSYVTALATEGQQTATMAPSTDPGRRYQRK
jgi:Cu2+-exporting ATPase